MTVRVWLHHGHDGQPGVIAWAPDLLGFSTWAESEHELIDALPAKLSAYAAWRAHHGVPVGTPYDRVEIGGRLTGNEILFPFDLPPASVEEIDLTMHLLSFSREDLIAQLRIAPEGVLDWDPPYRHFARWADWRTIRATLAHVANGETHYYTRSIGYEPTGTPAGPRDDWQEFLPRSRHAALSFLKSVKSSGDRRRVRTIDHGFGEEAWSVRKALRRLVGHELLHSKSIARIIRDYRTSQMNRRE